MFVLPRECLSWVRLLIVLLCASAGLRAHETGLSALEARLAAGSIAVDLRVETSNMRLLLPSLSGTMDGAARTALLGLAPRLIDLRAGETALVARRIETEFTAPDTIGFCFDFERPPGAALVFRFPRLDALPAAHRVLFVLRDESGAVRLTGLLSAEEPVIEIPREVTASASVAVAEPATAQIRAEPAKAGFRAFLLLGVEHIWTGYDHLLFLFGLLLVCATFRSIVAIISCFTLGHSMTLVLATFDLVNVSPTLVEPLIAASIVFVGVENLARRGAAPRGRPALTLVFGLIHGFGFASVLRDLGVGADGGGYAVPLFSFNLGVELGQLAVAAMVLPIVWRLRENTWFLRRGVPVLSALIAAAGLWWLIERMLPA